MNTHRYHDLLTAATKPPVGQMVLLSKLEEAVVVNDERFELSLYVNRAHLKAAFNSEIRSQIGNQTTLADLAECCDYAEERLEVASFSCAPISFQPTRIRPILKWSFAPLW